MIQGPLLVACSNLQVFSYIHGKKIVMAFMQAFSSLFKNEVCGGKLMQLSVKIVNNLSTIVGTKLGFCTLIIV